MLARGVRSPGAAHGVILLSPEHHDETVHLAAPIANDATTDNGKTWAWTLGQRYTGLARQAAQGNTDLAAVTVLRPPLASN
jgi:hypothetical protein